jgi:hypothetical protein
MVSDFVSKSVSDSESNSVSDSASDSVSEPMCQVAFFERELVV